MSAQILFNLIYFLIGIFAVISAEEPWGRDADLCYRASSASTQQCSTPFLGTFGEMGIRFHQTIISPADGPRSHFLPSSSHYTLEAMRIYGFFKGFAMGCDRLMRENEDPWVYRVKRNDAGQTMKWDPVRNFRKKM